MNLLQNRQLIIETCTDCGRCVRECAFLQNFGSPLAQAQNHDPSLIDHQERAFTCNLCGLCGSVCPVDLNPADMFLAMRQEAFGQRGKSHNKHRGILNYEKTGTSKRFTWYGLPRGCRTVFFPGCTLPGTRPGHTLRLYRHLKTRFPDLGIVLDCCTKPSHDLGREDMFHAMFGEMRQYLTDCGVTTVLVACPSCFKVFATYGAPLETHTAYEFINPLPGNLAGQVTVHDPCILRHHEPSQDAVRSLITRQGLSIREMDHHKGSTLCCGEGGAVSAFAPDMSDTWIRLRKKEAGEDRIISYCAGCTHHLGRQMPCYHILDVYFDPEKTLQGKAKVVHAPFTYLNRLRLKKRLRREITAEHERERPRAPGGIKTKGRMINGLLAVSLSIALIVVLRQSGIQDIFRGDNLKHWVDSYGMLAPMAFILLYTISPALFLPALPLTLTGGVLFGPVWGVVYSITGATSGACLSFMVSRYLARDLISSRLTHPRWQKLDRDVEIHGWKVVAITRLIPLFPFNLLNYAFGLTRIGFIPYAVTSFICMLPACVAFIVFSSSLSQLVTGHLSWEFIIGALLIILVSLFPVVYRRITHKKSSFQKNS